MDKRFDDAWWTFIGCGGTFFAAAPYLSVVMARHSPRGVVLCDPDIVEEVGDRKDSRQWPYRDAGQPKVVEAARMMGLDRVDPTNVIRRTVPNILAGETPYICLVQSRFVGGPDCPLTPPAGTNRHVVVVNVDNNETRLAVAQWVKRDLRGLRTLVVSGCDTTHGQAYYSLWNFQGSIHDWRETNPDVKDDSGQPVEGPGNCGGQTIRANAATGLCTGLALEDALSLLGQMSGGMWRPGSVREFRWTETMGEVRTFEWILSPYPTKEVQDV